MKFKKNDFEYSYEQIKSNKVLWFLILILSFVFFSLSFFVIPGLTTIHSYTIGILFGYYSPIFYISISILSLFRISTVNFLKFKYFNFNFKFVFCLTLAISWIVLFAFQTYFRKTIFVGWDIWKNTFDNWWISIKSSENPLWTPNTWNHGLISIITFNILTSTMTGYTTIAIAILIIIFSIYFLIHPLKKRNRKKSKKERKEKSNFNKDEIQFKTFRKTTENKQEIKKIEEKNIIKENDLPFEDPFN